MEVQILLPETETKSMQFVLMVFSLLIWSTSFAQVDMGSVLLKGSSHPEEGLESGRYQVKPIEGPLPKPKKQMGIAKKKVNERKINSENLPPTDSQIKPETPAEVPVAPSYADQVKGLVSGNNQPIEAYKEQVHPDDVRLNQLELNVLPGLLYYDSKSSYSYRNYQSYSPFASVGAEIWWTPFIGLFGQYGTSVGADVVDNGAAQSRTPVTHEMIEGGADFRKFFGLSRRSNSITFGVHYIEYKFSPPSDNAFRSRTKSNGIGIHFQARFPIAPSYAWVVGAKMEPRISHTEYGTALGLQSGSTPESSRMTLLFGGEFKLSREHQLIWNLSTALEKNQFTGAANLPDPTTGLIPQGVSVTQMVSFFTLGYRWGH